MTPTKQNFRLAPILLSTTTIPEEVKAELLREWTEATEGIPALEVAPMHIVENMTVPDTSGIAQWIPDEKRFRLRQSWFEENITQKLLVPGRNLIIWHFTPEEQEEWGLTNQILGTYWRDKDEILEAFICCDPTEMQQSTRRTRGIFKVTWLFLHEAAHGLVHFSARKDEVVARMSTKDTETAGVLVRGEVDPVHYADYVLKDVREVYKAISFEKWSLQAFVVKLLQLLIPLYKRKIDLDSTPTLPDTSETRKQVALERWAEAIKEFEGWFPGSRSYRQNNPGNLRWSPFETNNIDNFSVFPSYQAGFDALIYQLRLAVEDRSKVYNSEMTLYEFYQKYAPSEDNNHPTHYAAFVAKKLGVDTRTKLKDLIK